MMTLFMILVLLAVAYLLLRPLFSTKGADEVNFPPEPSFTDEEQRYSDYPYRPEVEYRLPNGKITTMGYAATRPELFSHWASGPDNVYGEAIDRQDWEDWQYNYYHHR